jgi:MFS family permease
VLKNAAAPAAPKQAPWKFALRALRYRNYRLFFGGQIVSLVGTWITMTASSWLVYRLTHSSWMLGVIGFASQLPSFVLAPLAGVYVDRWNRHRLLIATQTLSMVQSFALAALTLTGAITVPWLITLSVIGGVINAFDVPCRQSFVVSMIENKQDLGNAIALNSSMFNVARLIGPSLAGLIIAVSNEGWCFLLDGVSFIAVIGVLLAMTVPAVPARAAGNASAFTHFREGARYVYRFTPIRSIIGLLALVGLVGVPYGVLLPVFAGKIFQGGPHTLGFLMSASGCGALTAALWLASRKSVLGLGRLIPIATVVFGAGLIAFSLSRVLWLSLIFLFVTGFGFMTQMASSNTLIQTIVDDDKRGRVMSFFLMAFLGTAPFGSLIAGSLAVHIGAPNTILLSGVCCWIGALWFARKLPALREAIRPVYIRMGILPQMNVAIGDAAKLGFAERD